MADPQVPDQATLRAAALASPEDVTEWETAFHEAGHVVLALDGGLGMPDAVWINDDRSDRSHAGRTISRGGHGAEQFWLGLAGDADPIIREALADQAARCIEMTMGGMSASDRALGRRPPTWETGWLAEATAEEWDAEDQDSDTAHIVRTVEMMADRGWSVGQIETWLDERQDAVEDCLDRRWVDVERLAAALVAERRLDRNRLWDLLGFD